MKKSDVETIIGELIPTLQMPHKEAFDRCWICLVRLANLLTQESEHKRLIALVDIMPISSASSVLNDPAVNELIDLQPPLENVLTSPHEGLAKDKVAQLVQQVKPSRENSPKEALEALSEILERIRNKRAHGFKTPDGPRDLEILSASTKIVQNMAGLAAEQLISQAT